VSDAEDRAPFRDPSAMPVPPALESLAFGLAVAAVVLLAVALRLPGLDPPTLYVDDVWTALLARDASLSATWALKTHHPIGFLALLASVRRLVADPELSVQAVPFAASLCLIPLGAWAVRRWTGGALAGVLAALLVALNPELAACSVRAKPYATDAFLCFLLVAGGAEAVLRPSLRRLAGLALLSAAAIPFSYPAGLVGPVIVAAAFLQASRERGDRSRAAALFALYLAVSAALLRLALSGRGNESLQSYWEGGFLPAGPASAAAGFVASRTRLVLASSFPRGWEALGLLVPLGAVALSLRKATRGVVLLAVALWAALFAAAALRLYPLASRTVAFAYAPIALFAAAAVAGTSFRLGRRVFGETLSGVLAASLVLTASVSLPEPEFDDARIVETLVAAARPGAGVLIYPHANWSVGYYAGWPIRLVPVDYYGTRFEARPLRERTTVLPGVAGYEERPELLKPALDRFFSDAPDEVLYLAIHLEVNGAAAHARVLGAFRAAGFAGRRLARGRGADLLLFRRTPPSANRLPAAADAAGR
jgi:hypothetical protein